MPSTRRSSRCSSAKPAIMPAWRRAGDGADDDVVEEHVELGLLGGDLAGPVGEAEPAERVVGCAGRDRVRLPPAASTDASARFQLSRMPMSNPAGSMRTSPPMMRVSWMLPTWS